MSNEKSTLERIRFTRDAFDIDSLQEGDRMYMPTCGAEYDGSQPSEVQDLTPLADSLEAVDFSTSKPFTDIVALLNARIDGWNTKAKNLANNVDVRGSFATMVIAGEEMLKDVANYVIENRQRARVATEEERSKLSPEANKLISSLIDTPDETDDEVSAPTPSYRRDEDSEAIAERNFVHSLGKSDREPMPFLEAQLQNLNAGHIPGEESDE